MKVVLIGTVSSSIFGFRKQLLSGLVKKGHDVYILTADLTDDIKEAALDSLGVKAVKYELARTGTNPVVDIKNAFYLYKLLKSTQPDVVLSYFSKPVIWGTLAARLAGVSKVFGMLEGLGYYFTTRPEPQTFKQSLIKYFQVILFRLSLPKLDKLVMLNPDDKRDLLDEHSIRVRSVYVLGGIGLDLKEYPFYAPETGKIKFIFVGRLLAEKGINQFLQAAELVKSRFSQVEFIVAGGLDAENPGSVDTSYLDELSKRGVVNYLGQISHVGEWLQASSVFVLPSYREGVPRSSQEAMAVGRAVITTDVPGCRQTVEDGRNGFLVPPFDATLLANAMEKFIADPTLIVRMGQESRKMAEEHFDADIVNKRLINYLKL